MKIDLIRGRIVLSILKWGSGMPYGAITDVDVGGYQKKGKPIERAIWQALKCVYCGCWEMGKQNIMGIRALVPFSHHTLTYLWQIKKIFLIGHDYCT